ncbi:hypothetical protein D3C87_1416480 [compost metagenome]
MNHIDEIVQLLRSINEKIAASMLELMDLKEAKKSIEVDELMTRMAVVQKLGISERTYNRWVKEGILVPLEIGNRHFYRKWDLEQAIERSVNRGYL